MAPNTSNGNRRRPSKVGRCRGGDNDQVEFGCIAAGGGERFLRRSDGKVGRRFVRRRATALTDAGALDDPGIVGVRDFGKIVVDDDLGRQVAANPSYNAAQGELTQSLAGLVTCAAKAAVRFSRRRFQFAVSAAKSAAMDGQQIPLRQAPW